MGQRRNPNEDQGDELENALESARDAGGTRLAQALDDDETQAHPS